MARKSKGIALLLLVILLLVLISSRQSPRPASLRPESPQATDDPIPSATPVPATPEPVEATPEPPPSIYDMLPGASRNDWNLRLVNNTYVLSNTFAPDVTPVRNDQYFDSRAADKLEEFLQAAEAAGYSVYIRAAYRPFSTQAYLFNGRASQIQWGTTMTLLEAEQEARKVVAYPGTSEHQLGLCADIMDSKDTPMKAEDVENHPLLVWLKQHCAGGASPSASDNRLPFRPLCGRPLISLAYARQLPPGEAHPLSHGASRRDTLRAALPHLPFPGRRSLGPPMARLRKLHPAFLCRWQRRAAIPPRGEPRGVEINATAPPFCQRPWLSLWESCHGAPRRD